MSDEIAGTASRLREPLSRPSVFRPSCHVWVSSKRQDTLISDDLPQHAEDLTG